MACRLNMQLYRFIVEYVTVLISICKHKPWSCFGSFQRPVPFILQCCSASFAISEMNFWDANDMRRILKTQNKDDSDNQLVEESCMNELFRLTCSLHSVHCSLLPAHGKLVKVYLRTQNCAPPLPAASSHTDKIQKFEGLFNRNNVICIEVTSRAL